MRKGKIKNNEDNDLLLHSWGIHGLNFYSTMKAFIYLWLSNNMI